MSCRYFCSEGGEKRHKRACREGHEGLRGPTTASVVGICPIGHAKKGWYAARASSRATENCKVLKLVKSVLVTFFFFFGKSQVTLA